MAFCFLSSSSQSRRFFLRTNRQNKRDIGDKYKLRKTRSFFFLLHLNLKVFYNLINKVKRTLIKYSVFLFCLVLHRNLAVFCNLINKKSCAFNVREYFAGFLLFTFFVISSEVEKSIPLFFTYYFSRAHCLLHFSLFYYAGALKGCQGQRLKQAS